MLASDQEYAEMQEAIRATNGGQKNTLIVKFYVDAVLDEKESNGWIEFRFDPITGEKKEFKHEGRGRKVYRDAEFVEIRAPGNKDDIVRRQAREFDRLRFPVEYAAFKQGLAEPSTGTPLDHVPGLSKAQVLEFKAIGIRTAEDLANVNDVDGQKFMDFQRVRSRVRDFLAAAEGNAPLEKMRSELEQRDARIAALEEQIRMIAEAQTKRK